MLNTVKFNLSLDQYWLTRKMGQYLVPSLNSALLLYFWNVFFVESPSVSFSWKSRPFIWSRASPSKLLNQFRWSLVLRSVLKSFQEVQFWVMWEITDSNFTWSQKPNYHFSQKWPSHRKLAQHNTYILLEINTAFEIFQYCDYWMEYKEALLDTICSVLSEGS